MELYRKSLSENPARFAPLAKRFEAQNEFVLEGDEYKKPKGSINRLLDRWYNKKMLILCRDAACVGDLFKPELTDRLLKGFKFLMPYQRYLMKVLKTAE